MISRVDVVRWGERGWVRSTCCLLSWASNAPPRERGAGSRPGRPDCVAMFQSERCRRAAASARRTCGGRPPRARWRSATCCPKGSAPPIAERAGAVESVALTGPGRNLFVNQGFELYVHERRMKRNGLANAKRMLGNTQKLSETRTSMPATDQCKREMTLGRYPHEGCSNITKTTEPQQRFKPFQDE